MILDLEDYYWNKVYNDENIILNNNFDYILMPLPIQVNQSGYTNIVENGKLVGEATSWVNYNNWEIKITKQLQ